MADEEARFREWYKQQAARLDLSPDPDDPQHFYDWRGAWRSGATADSTGHWPSKFKREGHPNLVVDGVDTRTGDPIVEFYNQQKGSVAEDAKRRLAARGVDPDAPVDPEEERRRAGALNPWQSLLEKARTAGMSVAGVDVSPGAAAAPQDLQRHGLTFDQGEAYVPGMSEALYRGVSPYQDYYEPGQTGNALKSIPEHFTDADARFNPDYTDGANFKQLEDAWRMYLGLPQQGNSYGVSEFTPSRSSGTAPYYYRVNDFLKMVGDWQDIEPNDALAQLIWAAENPDKAQHVRKHPVLGTYQLNTGEDDRGRYLSYYDKWDLAPQFGKSGVPLNLSGMIGKPFEIYDRIYYDPQTFEPITPRR